VLAGLQEYPEETWRATLTGLTPDGERTTLIIARRGLGRAGRVWLTFDGAIRTTVVLTEAAAAELAGSIGVASGAR
jgi:biotin-(acetyl-CoA carboxylase) ligase